MSPRDFSSRETSPREKKSSPRNFAFFGRVVSTSSLAFISRAAAHAAASARAASFALARVLYAASLGLAVVSAPKKEAPDGVLSSGGSPHAPLWARLAAAFASRVSLARRSARSRSSLAASATRRSASARASAIFRRASWRADSAARSARDASSPNRSATAAASFASRRVSRTCARSVCVSAADSAADATLAANAARVSTNAVSAATARARASAAIASASKTRRFASRAATSAATGASSTRTERATNGDFVHTPPTTATILDASPEDGSDARFAKYDDVAYSTKSWPSALASAW